jgi:hypothetical protein
MFGNIISKRSQCSPHQAESGVPQQGLGLWVELEPDLPQAASANQHGLRTSVVPVAERVFLSSLKQLFLRATALPAAWA